MFSALTCFCEGRFLRFSSRDEVSTVYVSQSPIRNTSESSHALEHHVAFFSSETLSIVDSRESLVDSSRTYAQNSTERDVSLGTPFCPDVAVEDAAVVAVRERLPPTDSMRNIFCWILMYAVDESRATFKTGSKELERRVCRAALEDTRTLSRSFPKIIEIHCRWTPVRAPRRAAARTWPRTRRRSLPSTTGRDLHFVIDS